MSRARYSTPEEYAELDRLEADGLSQKEIAKRMGRSIAWVCIKLKRRDRRTLPKGQRTIRAAPPPRTDTRPWKPGDPKPNWLQRGPR